jgi:HupE / UreJ protein
MAAKAVLRVVTAFTVGHSITLIAAALGPITVPSRPVEVLIAASVAVAAVHAIRPPAARGEVIPSLYLLSRTRFYPAFRVAGASLALAAATGWGLDRLGALDNPLGAIEAAAAAHLTSIVALLAGLAIAARLLDGRPGVLRTQTASAYGP